MKRPLKHLWILGLPALAVGCAHGPPRELTDARSAYDRVATGPAGQLDPAGVYDARKALDAANSSYDQDGDSDRTKDLAYVAERRAEYAEVQTRIAQENQQTQSAQQQLAQLQAQQTADARAQLDEARRKLDEAQRAAQQQQADQQRQQQVAELQRQQQEAQQKYDQAQQQAQQAQQQLEQEREARAKAEQQAQQAMQDLQKVANVRREQRGLVISLSGSVLFASGRSTILPTAQQRLDQVAQALQESEDTQKFIVEGHTDDRGSDSLNQQLSQSRADAVRNYLISRGVEPERITAVGMGRSAPVADNATAEGRANNRRVEIVVQPARAARSGQPGQQPQDQQQENPRG